MTTLLVSSSEVENMLREIFLEQHGSCFSSTIVTCVGAMIWAYSHSGSDTVLDAVIQASGNNLSDYNPMDAVVDQFINLIESQVDISTHTVEIMYYPQDEALALTLKAKPPLPLKTRIKDDYHHATEHGDHYPERLRRALEEFISSGL